MSKDHLVWRKLPADDSLTDEDILPKRAVILGANRQDLEEHRSWAITTLIPAVGYAVHRKKIIKPLALGEDFRWAPGQGDYLMVAVPLGRQAVIATMGYQHIDSSKLWTPDMVGVLDELRIARLPIDYPGIILAEGPEVI
ncbi:MAG TPA: hypothetical protein VHB51_02785 [Candidatus Saccharimonadales bacterium]|nr:hypothetical protein [Candidatus Saccharimonadales bacterium]